MVTEKPLTIAAKNIKQLVNTLNLLSGCCPNLNYKKHFNNNNKCKDIIIEKYDNIVKNIKEYLEWNTINRDVINKKIDESIDNQLKNNCKDYIDKYKETMERSIYCMINITTCRSLSSKLASFTSFAATYGIGPSLAFYISKADKNIYKKLYSLLKNNSDNSEASLRDKKECINIAEGLLRECSRGGETIVLVLAVLGMEKLGVFQARGSDVNIEDIIDLIDFVVVAEENGLFQRNRRRILEYLTYLKRYADGIFG